MNTGKKENKNNQGKDPKAFEESSHKKDPSTFQGRKEEEEKEKKKNKKKVKHSKRKWWKKCEELTISLYMMRIKNRKKEHNE